MKFLEPWLWRAATVAGLGLLMALLRGWPVNWSWSTRICIAAWLPCVTLCLCLSRIRRTIRTDSGGAQMRHGIRLASFWSLFVIMAITWLLSWGCFARLPAILEAYALKLEAQLTPVRSAQRAFATAPTATASAGHWLWNDGVERRLPDRTDLKPGTKPEVFIRFAEPSDVPFLLKSKAYVRAFAFGRYSAGGAWSALGGVATDWSPDSSGWVSLSAIRKGRWIQHEVFHAQDPSGNTPLVALQGVVSAEIGPLESKGEGVWMLPSLRQIGGYQYRVASQPMVLDDLPDGQWLAAPVRERDDLRAVPVSPRLRDALAGLIQTHAAGSDVKFRLLELRNRLQTRFAYSLQTSNPNQLEPLENFLCHERRGHCEHFATAAALCVRMMGFPARVAYGWTGGTWFDSAGLLMFRASEAHAWAEVYLEPLGWVVLDATPPGSISASRFASPQETLTGVIEETRNGSGEKPDDSAAASGGGGAAWMSSWSSLVVAAMLTWFLWWQLGSRARLHRTLHTAAVTDFQMQRQSNAGYLQAWNLASREIGLEMNANITLREQLACLKSPPPFAERLWTYHYAVTYENQPTCKQTEALLVGAIQSQDWRGPDPGRSGEL